MLTSDRSFNTHYIWLAPTRCTQVFGSYYGTAGQYTSAGTSLCYSYLIRGDSSRSDGTSEYIDS